jgi:Sulfotransferase domain
MNKPSAPSVVGRSLAGSNGGGANLVLAGVGKAGTTSLFSYLSQHRDIAPSRIKETRYFLPMSETEPDATGTLAPIETYHAFFTGSGGRYRMEATPHYFHGGCRLVSALSEASPSVRVVITLREPVARFWSIYRFARSMLRLPARITLDEFAREAERLYLTHASQTMENRPYWTSIAGSMYHEFLMPWFDMIPVERLKFVFFEHLVRAPHEVVKELCEWLEIDGAVDSFDYDIQNRSVDYRFKTLQRVALFANSERILRNHRAIKKPLRAAYYRINGRVGTESLDAGVRKRLEELFEEPNRLVSRELTERGIDALPVWLSPSAGRPR